MDDLVGVVGIDTTTDRSRESSGTTATKAASWARSMSVNSSIMRSLGLRTWPKKRKRLASADLSCRHARKSRQRFNIIGIMRSVIEGVALQPSPCAVLDCSALFDQTRTPPVDW